MERACKGRERKCAPVCVGATRVCGREREVERERERGEERERERERQ